jgi:hypothetical protein
MKRDELISIATSVLEWLNADEINTTSLPTILSPQVSVPYPVPGIEGSYEGLVALTRKCRAGFPDYEIVLRGMVVDERENTVVILVNLTGTQTGWGPPPSRLVRGLRIGSGWV